MRNISKPGGPLDAIIAQLESAVLAMGRAAHGLRDPFAASCEHFNLTAPQLHALHWLGVDGALTMGELARRVGVSEKTITGIVDRMESASLLKRVRDESDRRIVRAEITPHGQKVFVQIRAEMRERAAHLLGLLDPEDRQGLVRIISTLRDRVVERAQKLRDGNKETEQ